ncbi:hypothetical protein BC938DRAFT_474997 [Jimgerdemannia flammicorona]|uniref:Uncharacterized protein n=1 Tax=Jimgerdemannia flammicorona TaxID=994334 RepID=A0A433QS40_9FUNG|nr:hypothetical protein BC938DRAFT_474997 [Jimgerdemannia flammicorona]
MVEWDEMTRGLGRVFNMMISDRNPMPNSKRQGVLYITNLTLKIYFKVYEFQGLPSLDLQTLFDTLVVIFSCNSVSWLSTSRPQPCGC